ncbi:MAG: phosphocholine cytidylyltransferase family protein [Actinomycetota bacterium]|nr:phosphocholine cytidylyltransferase family protein [Actinomycetota bacterium]
MIGMVLAAGAGRRLRPITDTVPKALAPVDGDTTILDIALRNLAAVELRRVVIVVGYRAETIEQRQRELEQRHGVDLVLVHNDRAEDWNNCYSLWLAREHFGKEVLLLNGDTVHPISVEHTMLAARGERVVLAIDDAKKLGAEEMKTVFDRHGYLSRITKVMAPEQAFGEYIGATYIPAAAGDALANALEETWRRDPDLYYEDGYQTYADHGGEIGYASVGGTSWVEVDDHDDLARAREIACHY